MIAPAVYGGKLRRILAYLDPQRLHARDLSLLDVQQGLKATNVFLPTGNARIGDLDYQVVSNAMPERVRELAAFPIAAGHDGMPILLRDVGRVEDGAAIQTNLVRVDGRRQVYIPIYRQPGANTLEVVSEVRRNRDAIYRSCRRHPAGQWSSTSRSTCARDRSSRWSAMSALAALAILVFLRSLRSAWIAALASTVAARGTDRYSACGQTLNR